MWIDESAFMSGSDARAVKRGRPQVYSDAMIQAVLTLKHVYHLTLRAAQGFVQSLRELAFADLPVPNYPTRAALTTHQDVDASALPGLLAQPCR